MSDLIDRQAAIDMIEEYFNGLPIAVHYDMLAMIHRLPSAEPEKRTEERTETHACDYGQKETHGDVIYRQKAIDAICKKCKADYPDTSACDICDEIEILKKLPTADVRENVRGYNTKKDKYFHCSICGYGVSDVYESSKSDVLIFEHGEEWKFCPCCGAEIMEENNE